jgi:NADH dehydrogenase FAD-containing subunit
MNPGDSTQREAKLIMTAIHATSRPPRVVIVGAGFDGLSAAKQLAQAPFDVTIVDRHNYCDCSGVSLGQERLQTRTIIWAAGVKASPVAEWLRVESDRAGRVKVQGNLSVPGHPNIFVVGDAAAATGPDGKSLPGLPPLPSSRDAMLQIC